MKTHVLTADAPRSVPPYLANGAVGLRPDPHFNSGYCTVNSYAGADPTGGVESWLYGPYPLALHIDVGGVWLRVRS